MPLYTCDENGFILTYNKAAVALWGREPLVNREKWCGSKNIFYTDGRLLLMKIPHGNHHTQEKKAFASSELIIQQTQWWKKKGIGKLSPFVQWTRRTHRCREYTGGHNRKSGKLPQPVLRKINTIPWQRSQKQFLLPDSTGLYWIPTNVHLPLPVIAGRS